MRCVLLSGPASRTACRFWRCVDGDEDSLKSKTSFELQEPSLCVGIDTGAV